MEMSRIQLYMRAIRAWADVESYRVNCGMLTRDDWARINLAKEDCVICQPSSCGVAMRDRPPSTNPARSPARTPVPGT